MALALEDLELSLQNIVTSLNKEKLIELSGHIGLKEKALSDKGRLSLTKLILSEVDKQNVKFDETGKSESKKIFMQDLISLAKGTVPPLENGTGFSPFEILFGRAHRLPIYHFWQYNCMYLKATHSTWKSGNLQ